MILVFELYETKLDYKINDKNIGKYMCVDDLYDFAHRKITYKK